MQLATLRTFLAIVETGSLVRASARLNVTQSTVTARLKSLEAELGQTLLVRQKSGVALTPAGYKFQRYAEAMTELWQQARRETSLPDGIEAVLNLGCQGDLWRSHGAPLAAAIRRRQPATALTAWPADPRELEGWLATGLIDAALTYRRTAREGQSLTPLPAERLLLVSTRADAPVRFDPGYIYVDHGEEFGRRHAAAYADAASPATRLGSPAWALDLMLATGGSAYLPARLAAPHLAAGRLHAIAGAPEFRRPVYLATNDAAAAGWPWLAPLVAELFGPAAHS